MKSLRLRLTNKEQFWVAALWLVDITITCAPVSAAILPVKKPVQAVASTNRAAKPAPQTKAIKQDPEQVLIAKIGVVTGRVLAPDGKPVAGAHISWISYAGITWDHTGTVLAVVQSDLYGGFRFEDSRALLAHSLKFSGKTLVVPSPQLLIETDSWGVSFSHILLENPGKREVRLSPPTDLQLAFLDDKGQPVSGLHVRLRALFFNRAGLSNLSMYVMVPGGMKRFTTQTDAAGKCWFPGLPQGSRTRIELQDERFAELSYEESDIALSYATQTLAGPIRLVAGAKVSGRITYGPSGEPAEGVRVGAQATGLGEGGGDAVSDRYGYYQLNGLRVGSYNIALGLNENMSADWTARAHENVAVSPGDQLKNMDFKLVHGAVITGRVMITGSRQGLPDVEIGVYGPAHPQSSAWVQRVTTAPDGTYRLRVPEGKQLIYFMNMLAQPQGPPVASVSVRRSPRFSNDTYEFTTRDGQTVTINWKFPRVKAERPVHVQVLDANGKAAGGAHVLFGGGNMEDQQGDYLADAEGRLTLNNLGGSKSLLARKGDSATVKATQVIGGKNVTLRLQPKVMSAITGCVTDAAGKPLAGIAVSLMGRSGWVITDEQGRYTFSNLWPHWDYAISATAPGYSEAHANRFVLKRGETTGIKRLVLVKAESLVEGRVINASGDRVAGVNVSALGSKTPWQQTTTDRDGRFCFGGVVANDGLRLHASSFGTFADMDVKAGSTDVVLELKAPIPHPRK